MAPNFDGQGVLCHVLPELVAQLHHKVLQFPSLCWAVVGAGVGRTRSWSNRKARPWGRLTVPEGAALASKTGGTTTDSEAPQKLYWQKTKWLRDVGRPRASFIRTCTRDS